MLISLSNEDFIKTEFTGLDLGDERLNKRILKVGEMINGYPSLSFPNGSRAVKAELKAFYRFFQNDKITDKKVLSTHFNNTIQRCLACNDRILLVTDTTYVSPAISNSMDGLKDMGKAKGNMLRVHYMIAVQESNGEVLGLTDFRVIGKELQQTHIRLTDESDVWNLVAETTVKRMKDNLGEKEAEKLISLCTYVADREGDDFDLLVCVSELKLGFVIRSQYDRKNDLLPSAEGCNLIAAVRTVIAEQGQTPYVYAESSNYRLGQASIDEGLTYSNNTLTGTWTPPLPIDDENPDERATGYDYQIVQVDAWHGQSGESHGKSGKSHGQSGGQIIQGHQESSGDISIGVKLTPAGTYQLKIRATGNEDVIPGEWSAPQNFEVYPGKSGDSHGKSGKSPGKSGESHGKSGESHGKSGESPGQSGDSPGQSGK